MNATIL